MEGLLENQAGGRVSQEAFVEEKQGQNRAGRHAKFLDLPNQNRGNACLGLTHGRMASEVSPSFEEGSLGAQIFSGIRV